jgi:hypothetical protein
MDRGAPCKTSRWRKHLEIGPGSGIEVRHSIKNSVKLAFSILCALAILGAAVALLLVLLGQGVHFL